MTQQAADLLEELKRFLQFQKDSGIETIPVQSRLHLIGHPGPQVQSQPAHHDPVNRQPAENRTTSKTTQDMPPSKSSKTGSTKSSGGQKRLQAIQEEMGDCTRCKLSAGRKTIVFGSGNPDADLLFIGEGPGADEDEQGLPFVGRAGQKLTEIIEKGMQLSRANDTYICNIVKCRPPGNRDPEADEIASCKPFLEQQVQAVRPKVIVALGKPAASTLLGRSVAITKERGTWHEFMGVPLMLTFHPAYLLRAYTLENRKAVMDDMTQVLERLQR